MSNDTNHVVLIGRLTKDAELLTFENGKLLKFSIANNRRVKESGEWKDRPNFFNCTMWSKSDKFAVMLTKGKQVCIDGELKQDRWEKDGKKFSGVTIEVKDLQPLGGKSEPVEMVQQVFSDNSDIPF